MIVECPGCKRRYDVSGRPPGSRARCRCETVFLLPEPNTQSEALKCPNCGANAERTATSCTFCKADLAMRACPRCFGQLFLGTKFCPQCGAMSEEPASALPDGSASPRYCPRCGGGHHTRLESRLTHDVMLDTCPECSGVFLDSDLLERMLAERRYRSDDPLAAPATGPESGRARPEQSGPFYVKCPDCEGNMTRRMFAKGSGVIVDICRHHGTWLDADELQQLIAFVQRGGLDASRGSTTFDDTALRPNAGLVQPANANVLPRSAQRDSSFIDSAFEAIFQILK